MRLFAEKIEERRHCVPVQRRVHRLSLLRYTFIILIALHHFYLIVSCVCVETGPSPARLEVRPRTSPQMASLACFRLSEVVKIARNAIFRR
jgi:hypothetical protein